MAAQAPSNPFAGRKEQPGDAELSQILGPSRLLWDQVLTDLASENLITNQEWHSSSVKAGWLLRLQHRQRNIVYLVPREGAFQAAFVFGDKALAEIRAARFPRAVIQIIDGARKYAEGTGVRLDVKTPADVTTVKKLAAIKVAN